LNTPNIDFFSNKAQMALNRKHGNFSENLTDEDIDHLPYLKESPSIIEEDTDELRKRILVCAACDHPVTTVSEKINVRGRHDHAFRYYDTIVRLGCFRNAEGCLGVQGISNGYSWFRGYSWQIQVCRTCYNQLGWKYMSEDNSFYGLIFKTLRETGPEED
jgi:hypothetical protein